MRNAVPFWSLWRPPLLTASQRTSLFASFAQKATDAESRCQWRRADFYWDQASRFGKVDIDLYAGFARAHAQGAAEKPSERAADLWTRIMKTHHDEAQILRFFPFIEEQCWKFVGQGAESGFIRATKLVDDLWEPVPGSADVQQLWIEIHQSVAMNRAKLAPEGSRARVIERGIEEIKRKESALGHHIEYFRLVGVLEHQLAVYLANEQKMADAVTAVGRAMTYNPTQNGINESYEQLVEAMKNFRAQVYEVVEQVQMRPNSSLNAEGIRLKAQADRGFSGLTSWNEGKEAQRIAELRDASVARTSWIRVGLQQEDRWTEKGVALISAIHPILQNPPADDAELARRISEAKVATTELDDGHWKKVQEWLRRRIFHEPAMLPIPTQTLRSTTPDNKKEEDLRDWLAGPADIRIKLQIASAAILILVAGTMMGLEAYRAEARNADWVRITNAVSKLDDSATISGAESFLQHSRPRSEDPAREVEVRKYYEEALIRWVATQPEGLSTEAARRIETFQDLMKDSYSEKGN